MKIFIIKTRVAGTAVVCTLRNANVFEQLLHVVTSTEKTVAKVHARVNRSSNGNSLLHARPSGEGGGGGGGIVRVNIFYDVTT